MFKEYLIHSYLYYKLDSPVITDDEYDQICTFLYHNFDVNQSIYKKYVLREHLKAGTGFAIRKYPKEIVAEAEERAAEWQAKKVLEYRVVTDNPDELYNSLKDTKGWMLAGLFVEYNYFLKCNPRKRKMALGVIERIFEERKNDAKDKGEDPQDA